MFTSLTDVLKEELDQENLDGMVAPEDQVIGAEMDLEGFDSMDETVTEAEVELMQLEVQFETIVKTEVSHTNLISALESTIENGGLRGAAVDMAQEWYREAAAPLGELAEEIPSVESFGEEGGAITETENTVMAAKGNLGKLKAAGKGFAKKVIEAIKRMIAQYFTKHGRVQSKVVKAEKAARAAKGTLKTGKAKVAGANMIPGDAKALAKMLKSIKFSGVEAAIKQVLKDNDDATAVSAAYQSLASAISKDLGGKEAKDEEIKAAGISKESYEKFMITEAIGGSRVVFAIPAPSSDKTPTARLMKIAGRAAELDVVEPTKASEGMTDVMNGINDVIKAGESMVKGLESEAKAGGPKAKGMITFVGDVMKFITSAGLQAAEAQANFVAACVKAKGAKADSKSDEKKDEKKDDKSDEKKEGEGEE
jgi:hypothetical protein